MVARLTKDSVIQNGSELIEFRDGETFNLQSLESGGTKDVLITEEGLKMELQKDSYRIIKTFSTG